MYKESIKFNTIMLVISITVILIALLLTGCGQAKLDIIEPMCDVTETENTISVECDDGTNISFETKVNAVCDVIDVDKHSVQIDCNDSVITIDIPKKGKGHKK